MIIGELCETYPPSLDGVGRVMLSYCKTLSAMGHRALYIAPDNPMPHSKDECETLLYPSASISRLLPFISLSSTYRAGIPMLGKAYRQAAKRLPFDILHAHSPFISGHAARRIARRCGIPLVATFHSRYYNDFLEATHSKALSRLLLRYVIRFYDSCDEVWTLNEDTAKVLREYGYKSEPVIMPNGTDIVEVSAEAYEAAVQKYGLRPNEPVLIFVGQMDEKKNPFAVLRACAKLSERGIKHKLVMVGTGKDIDALKELSRDLGLRESVIFTGHIDDRETTLSLLKRADLMVFPSIYDTAAMVIREAAAMGTPAVLVRGTGSAEGVTDGDNGFLCDNEPGDIAAAIERALPLAAEVGIRARATIPIPWSEIMRDALGRYSLLIERRRERRSK